MSPSWPKGKVVSYIANVIWVSLTSGQCGQVCQGGLCGHGDQGGQGGQGGRDGQSGQGCQSPGSLKSL